jgi:hypothetical protein
MAVCQKISVKYLSGINIWSLQSKSLKTEASGREELGLTRALSLPKASLKSGLESEIESIRASKHPSSKCGFTMPGTYTTESTQVWFVESLVPFSSSVETSKNSRWLLGFANIYGCLQLS